MPKIIFSNTNTVSTMVKYQKGTSEVSQALLDTNMGTCAAQSALWLKNVASMRIELTKPNATRSQIVFQKCWMKTGNEQPDAFNRAIMRNMSVLPGPKRVVNAMSAFFEMASKPGRYYIDLGGHIVAAAVVDGRYFLFDPNHACWEMNGVAEFRSESRKILARDGWTGVWTIYKGN